MSLYAPEYLRIRRAFYTTDSSGADGTVEAATTYLTLHYGIFENALTTGPYFLGERFCILSTYAWMIAQWWGDYNGMRRDWPKTLRLVETAMNRPKIKPVHDVHFDPGIGSG